MNPTEDKSKKSKDEYTDFMIQKYGIEFEGRIMPGNWGEYTSLFEAIRRIGDLRRKEFSEMFPPNDAYFVEKTIKAAELVKDHGTVSRRGIWSMVGGKKLSSKRLYPLSPKLSGTF